MANQGFDPTFGLRGTCATEVSGFGGWPLGIVVGKDGRPTIVCQATSQKKVDHDNVMGGGRFRKPRFSTIRIVSFPPDGRPVPHAVAATTSRERIAVFGPDPTSNFRAVRAIVRPDRIAVLGGLAGKNGESPALFVFDAGTIRNGVAEWTLSQTAKLSKLSGVSVDQCGLGWDGKAVVVVAPRIGVAKRVDLLIYTQRDNKMATTRLGTILVVGRLGQGPTINLDFPSAFNVNVRASGVHVEKGKGLYVGLTWEGSDPQNAGRIIDASRASVASLVRVQGAYTPNGNFGVNGLWLATAQDGEITTADHLVLLSKTRVAIGGRATRGATYSLFVVAVDDTSGNLQWSSYPAGGVLARMAGMTAISPNRILLCGSSQDWMPFAQSDPSEAVVIRLGTNGQPDAGFAVNGVARFRLHGGTHPGAVTVKGSQPLVASAVPWGVLNSAGSCFQPCVSQLTAGGGLDPAFGVAGLCRHDGIGGADLIAIGPTGQVWSAGLTDLVAGPQQFQRVLAVARMNPDGGPESGFGFNGIAIFQLSQLSGADTLALIALADGRAVVNGTATGGSWIMRLRTDGQLDPTFGAAGTTPGVRFYAGRTIELVSELAGGSLQGFNNDNGTLVRLTADGSLDTTFGNNGEVPAGAAYINHPISLEPNGEFFALAFGKNIANLREVGLLRFQANGALDTTFGAGSGPSTSDPNGAHDPRFANLPDIARNGNYPFANDNRNQTFRLADGTFLTFWTIQSQADVGGLGNPPPVQTNSLVLLAWDANGSTRVVPAWIPAPLQPPQSGKIIRNPAADIGNWLGWTYQCSVLQPDGSMVVCLSGDDRNAAPPRPEAVCQSPYFCLLVSSNFDRKQTFGPSGFLTERAPGCEFVVPGVSTPAAPESQRPLSARLLQNDQVVVGIRCTYPNPNVGGVDLTIPNLPLDGSIGLARLV